MIDFLTNNLVYELNGKLLRLLITLDESYVFIDINDEKALPFQISRDQVDIEVGSGKVNTVEDKWKPIVSRQYPQDHPYALIRDANFKRIEALVTHPLFFNPNIRGNIIDILLASGSGAKSTIYRYARRYWQRGQNVGALLPNYAECGGKGKKKVRSDKPLGRPNSSHGVQSTQMNGHLESIMHSSILDTILSGKCTTDKKGGKRSIFSLHSAYTHFMLRYCEGNLNLIDENRPSKASFNHYYYNHYSVQERAEKKLGKKYFSANNRPLTSTVRANSIGPGQSFSIDSTPFDVGVANIDRLPLGRPTLYSVVDDFSSAFVGVLLTITPPSYFNVVTALSIAFGSKVDYCQHFGLDIGPDEWPMEGISLSIFADLGSDYKTEHIEVLPTAHKITIKHSGAGQPDKRPVGEQSFARLKAEVKHKLLGLVGSNLSKKAGGNDSQLDYTLLLKELTRELMKAAITLNHKPLKEWDADSDFPSGLSKTPNNIWKWGIANRTGLLEKVDRSAFWLSALKREKATVTGDLLKIGKVQYRCSDFENARVKAYKKNKTVEVVRDENDASFIYLVPKTGEAEYIKCDLSPKDRRFVGKSWADVKLELDVEKQAAQSGDTGYLIRAVSDLMDTNNVVNKAKEEKHELTEHMSVKKRKAVLGNKPTQREESKHTYDVVRPQEQVEEQSQYVNTDAKTDLAKLSNDFFMDDEDE